MVGFFNLNSVNPNSVSFATVGQALTSQRLSLLECCFQSQQRRWLSGVGSWGVSEGGLEQVSGCEANSRGLLILLASPGSCPSITVVCSLISTQQVCTLGMWVFRNGLTEHCCPWCLKWTFNLCCKQRKDISFFLYRLCLVLLTLAYEDFLVP